MLDKLIAKIEREEGYSPSMYKCPADYWTIGAGINLEKQHIPKHVADAWLESIVTPLIETLSGYSWFNSLNQARQIVIADMAYQMGLAGLLQFQNMIQAIMDNDYEKAAEEMLDSRWARQTPNRANRNAQAMRDG
jgi:lysozyme